MVLRECPYCHRPFEAELLSKEQIDSSELKKAGDFPLESNVSGGLSQGNPVTGRGLLIFGLSEDRMHAVTMHPEAFITYKLNYECKHCGKNWAKLQVEEIQVPRKYLVDEDEKTDYDAHVEEEEAREQDYARR